MSARKPLVLVDGETQQLQAADWIDLSDDINLTVTSPITLTDDDIGLDQSSVDHGSISGLGDDDHTIYILADGTRDFSGVVVGVDPTSSNHLATKEYVDSAISFIEEFFLTDTASGISSYFNMVDQSTGEVESSNSTGSITQSDGQPLAEWITLENIPGMTDLEHGIYSVHIHVEKTGGGARDVEIYFEVWTRTHPGGSETLRVTSEVSSLITSKIAIDLHANLAADVVTNATDRLVIKFFANGVSGGNNATIILYAEGDTAAHFSVPISSEVLSTIFLRQDGTKALTGNMSVDAAITIDGRDLSIDGTKLDGIESLADVTDATNVAAAGAAMSGGAFHDGFSDFVGNKHIDWTSAGDNLSTSGSITTSTLTDGRVVLAGASGILEDDADLTFDGATLNSKNLNVVATTSSVLGIISQGGIRIFHTYKDPTAAGDNIFIGPNAGNFTMSPAGGSPVLASRNLGLGAETLLAVTTGGQNVAIGAFALRFLEDGGVNVAIGALALYTNVSGIFNIGIGSNALVANTGNYNIGIGGDVGFVNTGSGNTFIGARAGRNNDGSNSVFIGYLAGHYETASDKLFIDRGDRGNEANSRTLGLIYGVFGATALAQDLVINGQLGLNITPTAWITLPAGTATAGTAPIKLTSGTLTTAAVSGQIEFDGTNLYFTDSGNTRRTLAVV